jgi:hypothetical protein
VPRILVVTANDSLERLQLADEVRAIQAEVGARSNFVVIPEFEARLADLIDTLHRVKPAILHFAGHGSDGSRDAGMCLASDHGSVPLSGSTLAAILGNLDVRPRVIILNCCYSAEQMRVLRDFTDVVIGIRGSIDDKAANRFTADLYSFIGNSFSVAQAYQLARKVFESDGYDPTTLVLEHRESVDPADILFYGEPEIMARFEIDDSNKPPRSGKNKQEYAVTLWMRGVDENVDSVTYQLCHDSYEQPFREVHRSEDDDFGEEISTWGDATVRATAWSRDNGIGVACTICEALIRHYGETPPAAIAEAIADLKKR